MPFQINVEVAAAIAKLMGGGSMPPQAPIGDVQARRDLCDVMMSMMKVTTPSHDDVSETDFHTKALDGHEILLRWYTKTGTTLKDSPAVLHFHGGGMIAISAVSYGPAVRDYVHQTGVPFLAVEYRLAPEFPAPVAAEDGYAGLEWLYSNAAKLGVDANRISVMGDSGGGGIAAALAHYALKKKGPKIAKQILIYPMIDDRNTVPDENLVPFALWGYNDNATGWQAVLGSRCGGDDVLPHEAAARMTVAEARGLPEVYIDVGELDIFRDEDIEYARKCSLAGVSTELHVWPGVPHGWERMAPAVDISKTAVASRLKAILSIKGV